MKTLGLLMAAVLCGSVAMGQAKNTTLGELVAGSSLYQPAICVNGDNPLNIVAASSSGNIAYTVDGGQTWANAALKSPQGFYGDVALLSDTKGTFYVFFTSDPSGQGLGGKESLGHIVCQVSKDGGKTWGEETTIAVDPTKDQRRPWAILDHKNNLMLTWTQFDQYKNADANCQSIVMLTRSSNAKKWDTPIQVSQTPGTCNDDRSSTRGAMAAAAPDGKLFIAWSNQHKIFLDRSFNGGDLWLSNDIGIYEIKDEITIPGYTHMNSEPHLLADKGKSMFRGSLYMLWTDSRNGADNTDVLFSRSHNYGDNWTTPVQVNADTKGHQYLPWMTVDAATGYLYVIYYDRHAYTDNQTDVYLAYSTNGGATFKTTKLSETPFTPEGLDYTTAYNNVSASNGTIAATWTRADAGKVTVVTTVLKQTDFVTPEPTAGKKKK